MVRINYEGFMSDLAEDDESTEISDFQARFEVDAVLLMPFGFKPTTDENQTTLARSSHPLNQQYGFIAPPRRGDKVVAAFLGHNRWVVLSAYPAVGGNEQPPHTEANLSFIHRSGSSIRFNDQYPSSMTGLPTGDFDE
jgi:hypothetical protein